ncbi:MAG: peptidylprolyl isomerase [Opitutales bacterium]|nr:peptidylprolyl isomerase [Opitutales bacterium]
MATFATLKTRHGDIKIKLFSDKAPKTCENFATHIKNGYYDGLIFHRVIRDFMIQGGDPTGTGRGGESIWGKAFADEFSPDLSFDRKGLLAMANAGPNTNGSQFFITTVETPWLTNHHTIFGEVVEGYDAVEKIERCRTGFMDRPVEEQKIIKAEISEE